MTAKLSIIHDLVQPSQCELPPDVADWSEDWREEYEERAGIMEYDGCLPREQAEQWAETIVRAAHRLHHAGERQNKTDTEPDDFV